jgi:hypothetical protein
MRIAYIIFLAAIGLTTLGYAWILLIWAPPLEIAFLPRRPQAWPAASLPLLGVGFTLVALGFWTQLRAIRRQRYFYETDEPPRPLRSAGFVAVILASLGMAALLGLAAVRGAVEPVPAAMLLVFGVGTLIAASSTLAELRNGGAIGLSSNWGGLGGGLGGWKLTPALSAMLLTLILLGATLAIGTRTNAIATNESTNEADSNAQANAAGDAAQEDAAGADEAGNTAAADNQSSANEAAGNEASAVNAAGVR